MKKDTNKPPQQPLSSLSPFVRKMEEDTNIMVSDGFNPDDLDLQYMSTGKFKKEKVSPVEYDENKDVTTFDYDDEGEHTLFYSVDGKQESLEGTLISTGKKKIENNTIDILTIKFQPNKFSSKKTFNLVKDFIFGIEKTCFVHNIKISESLYLFDSKDELNKETANFDWHLQDVEYTNKVLTFQLVKSI